jgi:hypothetical protein
LIAEDSNKKHGKKLRLSNFNLIAGGVMAIFGLYYYTQTHDVLLTLGIVVIGGILMTRKSGEE